MDQKDVRRRGSAPLQTPTDLSSNVMKEIAHALNVLLVDTFAPYVRTNKLHSHISGPHCRGYHFLVHEEADQFSRLRTRSPSAFARSAARRCASWVTSPGLSARSTVVLCHAARCVGRACATTTKTWWRKCATRLSLRRYRAGQPCACPRDACAVPNQCD